MPRRIDAAARAEAIADASLRVLEAQGLAGLTVRKVADEAGIAVASLRRAFPTQHDLREHCFRLIEDRVTRRVRALTLEGRVWVEGMLAELLPLDRDRRLELVAQVQLGVLALTDPRLRESAIRLNEAVDYACSTGIQVLAHAGEFGRGREPEVEARRLRAVLDGVALQLLWQGASADTDGGLATLHRHLDELAAGYPASS